MNNIELQRIKQRYNVVGNCDALNRALDIALQVAPTDLSVLIVGESGVGKEIIPRIIHDNSPRRREKYFAINCGSIPEGTIDSELFGHEKHLPYAAWLETRGKGKYIKILISERYYSKEELIYEDRWKSDRFQNKLTGKLCKADDPQARRIVKAGDIRKTWISHFSLKSRMFTADGFARKHSNKKKRIGFDRLLSHIRQCIVAAFVKMKIAFEKAFRIPGEKRHEWMNQYQQLNVIRINKAIQHVEQELQLEWIALRDGYFLQERKTYDRFMVIAQRYLNRFKNGFFSKSYGESRKLKFSFSPFMNVVRVQENLDSLVEDFDQEIEEFRMQERYGI